MAGIIFHSDAIAWPAITEYGFPVIGARAASTALCVLILLAKIAVVAKAFAACVNCDCSASICSRVSIWNTLNG
jgi:hypothetical protein